MTLALCSDCGEPLTEGTCRANCQGDDSKEMNCKLDCDPDWSCERWLKCICSCDDDMVWNTEYGFCAEKQE